MTEITKNKFFYGWIIVGISTLALLVSNGLSIGGIPVFSEWVRNDFVASGAMAADKAQSIVANFGVFTFLTAGLTAPFAGYLIQKFPLKNLMLIGCVILGSALILHSQATEVWMIYLSRVMMGAALGLVGVLINTVLVSNWFVKKRGVALGILLCGTSFGGVVIPLLATPLIKNFGWRWAMIGVSLLIWVVLIPAIIFLVKPRPADLGLNPDNASAEEMTAENAASVVQNAESKGGMTLTEALKTPVFWVFAFAAALVFYPLFVTTQQFILYLRTDKIGMSPEAAAGAISLMSGLSIAGKFGFGYLSDKLSPTFVMLLCCLIMFIGTLFFLSFSASVVLFFVIPFGLGYGGTFVLLQRLIADYFGSREYPKILGFVTVIETIGAAIGGRITGLVADANGGDYTQAFLLVVVATGAALVLTLLLNFMVRKQTLATA
jgi:MFS family permease